jgi:cytochrome c biogenesis protein CcmG/thiol:disulfide interchange protein DsbE
VRKAYAAAAAVVVMALMAGVLLTVLDDGPKPHDASPRPLPELRLDAFASDSEPLELAGLRGPAVINVWASWCGPCGREMPVLEQFHRANADVGLIGIDFQDPQPEKAEQLVARTGVTYPLYEDFDGELSGAAPFPVLRGLPFTALVDEQGRVVHQEFGEVESVEELEGMVREHLGVGA